VGGERWKKGKDDQRRAESQPYRNQIEGTPSKTSIKTLGVIGSTCRDREGLRREEKLGACKPCCNSAFELCPTLYGKVCTE
jgi:hypothetical protein